MLRLETQSETAGDVTYALAGQLTREHLPELRRIVGKARATGRRVRLDLAAVVFVDRDLVGWLSCIRREQVELVNSPAYVLSWIRCEGGDQEEERSS